MRFVPAVIGLSFLAACGDASELDLEGGEVALDDTELTDTAEITAAQSAGTWTFTGGAYNGHTMTLTTAGGCSTSWGTTGSWWVVDSQTFAQTCMTLWAYNPYSGYYVSSNRFSVHPTAEPPAATICAFTTCEVMRRY